MDDWQQEWWKKLEETAANVEKFFLDIGEAAEHFADELEETVEDFVEQLQEVVVGEVDSLIENVVDLIAEAGNEVEAIIWEDFEDFIDESDFIGVSTQPASLENNPACIDCAHYHGQIYNGNLLVCAMHPYGWDDENCPDWEQE